PVLSKGKRLEFGQPPSLASRHPDHNMGTIQEIVIEGIGRHEPHKLNVEILLPFNDLVVNLVLFLLGHEGVKKGALKGVTFIVAEFLRPSQNYLAVILAAFE